MAPFRKRHENGTNKLTKPQIGKMTYDNNAPAVGFGSDVRNPSGGPEKPKRSISNSLKNKIKRVFHRSLNASTLPIHQVEASREYFGGYDLPPPAFRSSFENTPGHDEETLSRVRTQTRFLEILPSSAHTKLGESNIVRSEAEDSEPGSRVTSWTNSPAGNTVTTRDTKRLSIIREANPSITSVASVALGSPNRQPPPVPGLMAFRNPMSMECVADEAPAAVDPQRVVSALTEINGINPKEVERDTDEGTENDIFVPSRGTHGQATSTTLTMQSRVNSAVSVLSHATEATIQNITLEQPQTPIRMTSGRGAVRIPKADLSCSSTNEEFGSQASGTSCSQINVQRKRSDLSRPRNRLQRAPKATTPTAEQIASRIDRSKARWKTPLEENTPFFPKSAKHAYTVTKLARKISRKPSIRRAPSFRQPGSRTQTPALQNESENGSSLRPGDITSLLSPSIYSQASDEQSVKPNDSAVSLVESETGETGTAVIVISRPVKSYVIDGACSRPRIVNHSARSSKDWKDRLSREVSELEHPPQEDLAINSRYANKGHHRERAQIMEGENVTIDRSGSGSRKTSRLPRRYHRLKLVENPPSQTNIHLLSGSKLESRSSGRMNDRFPMIDTGRKASGHSNSSKTLRIRRIPETDIPPTRFSSNSKLKIYSDYTRPLSENTTGFEQIPTSSQTDKGNEMSKGNENVQASISTKSLSHRLTHPQTSHPLDISTWARSNSTLPHYTTSAAEAHLRPSESPTTPPRPRSRVSNRSTAKLASRPKSAIGLSSANLPASSSAAGAGMGVEMRRNRPPAHSVSHVRRKPITGRALEGDTLEMILAGPYSTASPPAPTAPCPSPPPSRPPAQSAHVLHKVALSTSSSELARSKEPGLGLEAGWGIESALEVPGSTAGPGHPTAWQRMAERFLGERNVGSESPVRLTPAFL